MCSVVFKCVLLLFAACVAVQGEDYFVGVSGSDANNNTCTVSTKPCKTIQYAFDQILSGTHNNSISVAQGTYSLTAPITFSTSYIGVSIVGTGNVVIDGQKNVGCFVIKSIESEIFIGAMQVTNCVTDEDGAAVNVQKSTVNLRGVTIDNNKAARGAAVFVTGGANVAVVDSNFVSNVATKDGGALFVDTGDVMLQNTGFYQNHATNGGAIAVDGTGQVSVTMIRGSIANNVAAQSGGGIYLSSNNTVVSFVNTTIFQNNAVTGGGLSCVASSVNVNTQFTGVSINQNNATKSANVFCGGCGNCGSCDACVSGACQLATAAGGCVCYSDAVRGYWAGANCSNCTQSDTIGHWGGETCTTCANDPDRGYWIGDKCDQCKKSWVGKGCDYQKFPFLVIIIVASVCLGIVVTGYVIGFPLFRIRKQSDGYSPIYD